MKCALYLLSVEAQRFTESLELLKLGSLEHGVLELYTQGIAGMVGVVGTACA